MSRGVAVVTGAGSGFGAALVSALSRRQWDVFAVMRRPLPAPRSAVRVVLHDVREAVPQELITALDNRPVDLLINNAGVGAKAAPLRDTSAESLREAFEVNVLGPLRLTQALQPLLLLAEAPSVVNVSSRLASLRDQADGRYADFATSYAYKVTKTAQNALTISMAAEFGDSIRCWALHPGSLTTGMGRAGAHTSPAQAAETLLDRLAEADRTSPRFVNLDGPDLSW